MSDKVVPIRRHSSGFVWWLILLVIALVAMLYMVIGRSQIDQIVVSGSVHYSREDIIEMMNIREDMTVMEVFMMRNDDVAFYPYVKDAKIDYNSFSSIAITVEEKKITSYIPYQNQFLALDKDGYIVGYEEEQLMTLPIVSGISYESSLVGQKLIEDERILRVLLDIHHLSSKYSFYFEKIDFRNGDASLIYIYKDQIEIVFGGSNDLDRKMRDASEVFDKISVTEAGQLDLSYESDAYVLKRTLDVAYYVKYGERYLAINSQNMITGLSPHRVKDLLTIEGLKVESTKEKDPLLVEGDFLDTIETLMAYAESADLTLKQIGFENGDINSIRLWIDNIYILFGDHEDYDHKFEVIKEVLNQEEEGVVGELDIRDDKEAYKLEKNVN